MYLTSCGDAVTLHELPTYSVKHVYMRTNSLNNNVKSVSWNKDGSGVASVYSKKGLVEIVCWKGDGTNVFQSARVRQATSGCFMRTKTSYVGIGTKSGEIVLWDCNTNAKLHTFIGCHSPVNLIDFNVNDSLLAAAADPSTITVFQYNTRVKLSTHEFPGLGVSSAIRFHPSERGILGATSAIGSVSIWDLTLNKKTFTADKCHLAPCSDLVFSKVHKYFMASIGYDKILLGHDLLEKEPVLKLQMEVPLTCLDMTSDGTTVAVGTMTGTVHVYDLRAASSPLHVVNTYRQQVNGVAYSPQIASCSHLEFPVMQKNSLSNLSDVLNYTGSLNELSTDSFFKSFDPDFMVPGSGISSDIEKLCGSDLQHTRGSATYGMGDEKLPENFSNVSHNFVPTNNNPADGYPQESVNVCVVTSQTLSGVQERNVNNNVENVSSNSPESNLNINGELELPIENDIKPLQTTFTHKVNLDGNNSRPISNSSDSEINKVLYNNNIECGKTSTPTMQLARPDEWQNLSKLNKDCVGSGTCDKKNACPYFDNISIIAHQEKPSIVKQSVTTMTDIEPFQIEKAMILRESYIIRGSLLWQHIGLKDEVGEALSSMQEKVETLTQQVETLTQQVKSLSHIKTKATKRSL